MAAEEDAPPPSCCMKTFTRLPFGAICATKHTGRPGSNVVSYIHVLFKGKHHSHTIAKEQEIFCHYYAEKSQGHTFVKLCYFDYSGQCIDRQFHSDVVNTWVQLPKEPGTSHGNYLYIWIFLCIGYPNGVFSNHNWVSDPSISSII